MSQFGALGFTLEAFCFVTGERQRGSKLVGHHVKDSM